MPDVGNFLFMNENYYKNTLMFTNCKKKEFLFLLILKKNNTK